MSEKNDSPRSVSRRGLEGWLAELEGPMTGGATAYLTPGTSSENLRAWWEDRLGAEEARQVGELVESKAKASETGAVLLWAPPEMHLVLPPFPVQADGIYAGWEPRPLLALLAQKPWIGVLLLRLGRYAVGVYHGTELVASKTDRRYVKGRHHAGGTSQTRFARVREKQVEALFGTVCQVLQRQLEPYVERLEHLFLGGERQTLLAFRKECPYLVRLSPRLRQRILDVRTPGQRALEGLSRQLWSSRVYTVTPSP